MKPGYKQTEVGVIPEEWEVLQICEVADLQVGFAFKSEWFGEAIGTRLLRGENVGYGKADWSETKTLKVRSDLSFRTYLLNPGDIVIGMDRTFTKTGSKLTVLNDADCPCLLVQRVGRFFPRRCDNRFLWFVLSSEAVQTRLRLEQKGMDIPHLSKAEILHPKAAIPPLPEQRAIAGALSDVDALLGAQEALLAKKRDLKAAAMQQLLTGETRLPGFTGEWEVKRLGEIAEMGSGGTPPSSVPDYYDGDIPWASISDMTKGGKIMWRTDRNLTRAGFTNSSAKMFPAGTILYAMYASLGECSIAGISLCSSQAILGIRPKNELSGEYLYYFLTSLKDTVKTQGQQGTQANLNKGMVQNFRLSLPPLPEQTAIAAVLSDMDAEIAALEAQMDKTRALKQGMMQELLTGRIRLI